MLPALLVALASAAPAGPSATEPAGATLSKSRLPTAGAQTSLLTVNRFGRFAITAKSKQGASLQLVDRGNGPGPIEGEAGSRDGRLDLFLDRGEHRIIARGAGGKDELELTAHTFREKNGPKPPMLVELKPIDETLADFEQRSYWIEITQRKTVVLEAGGRSLSDLRLFKDGTWLIDAQPQSTRAEPKATQPLRVLRLIADLEPGLYLLAAYGGPKEPWADDDGRSPFHLRYGVPRLPEAGRKYFKVGPFGYDRYIVSGAGYFRLELPEAKPATLTVDGSKKTIDKNSLPPVAELFVGPAQNRQITVTAERGQPYIFQSFDARRRQYIATPGNYYLSTVTAGHAEDSLDSTAVMIGQTQGLPAIEPHTAAVVELDGQRAWTRRFNLLSTATVFLRVREAGKYRLSTSGTSASANYKIEPLFLNPPPNYRSPPFQPAPAELDLDEGYFVLSLEPTKKGILEISLKKRSWMPSLGAPDPISLLPLTGLRVPSISVSRDTGFWVWLNEQPGVQAGMFIRPTPLDLRDPIYAVQNPAQPLSYDVFAAEAGTIRAEAEDGSSIPISVDDREKALFFRVEPGPHKVTVHAEGKHLVAYSLGLTPRTLEKDTPLPELPDARIAALPNFQALAPKEPIYFDLERESNASFLLRADRPGLYRVESTGLLETSGALRTRMITRLADAEANGVGRNFLLEQYLGTGDYQVTVRTMNMSRGRLGVRLGETRLIQGGTLREDIPARTTLATGSAAIFPFQIHHLGQYRLRAIAPGRTLRARIEDAEGWPLVQPGTSADVELELAPGKYRMVVLPEPVEVRVLAVLEEQKEALSFEGKGPHALPLGLGLEHTWYEIGRGESRKADVFTFELPAAAELNISLDESMRADLILLADATSKPGGKARNRVAQISRGSWSGIAEKGNYRLEIYCVREDDGVDYQLNVQPVPLLAGLSRTVRPPAILKVAIGDQRAIELSSFGGTDLRARLLDEAGRTIAASDDRPDDWNFLIAARVAPGNYRLAVDPVGAISGEESEISMTVRSEAIAGRAALPYSEKIRLGDQVQLIPFDPPSAAIIGLSASSEETIGVALEAETAPNSWRTLAMRVGRPARVETLALPPGTAKNYRARIWSADRRALPAQVAIFGLTPRSIDEAALAEGVTLEGSNGIAAAAVALDGAGLMRIFDAPEGSVRAASIFGDAFTPLEREAAQAESQTLYVVRELEPRRSTAVLRGERVRLREAPELVDLHPERSAFLDLPPSIEGRMLLVEAEAIGASIGVSFGSGARDLDALAVRDRAAISVMMQTPSAANLARVWALEEKISVVEARVRALSFDPGPAIKTPAGLSVGSLSKKTATHLGLAPGAKSVRLTLEDGAVAALGTAGRIERVFWADGGEEVLETNAEKLWVLNPTDRELRWSVELVAAGRDTITALTERAPYEVLRPLAGVVRLQVPKGTGRRTIHVRGEVESALYLGTGGTAARGLDLPIGADPGVLYLRAKPGLLVAWLNQTLFGPNDGSLTSASIPSIHELQGRADSFQVENFEPAVLHVRTDVPVISRVVRGGVEEVVFHPRGAALDAYLPRGLTRISFRALLGGVLSGSASFTTSPLTEIREGLGPEVMLSPGTMRVFKFTVDRARAIGTGVRSDSDAVECVLMKSDGRQISRGHVLQMMELEKGEYLLGLRTPETASPARVRPALAGLSPPHSGPPLEIVRSYLLAE